MHFPPPNPTSNSGSLQATTMFRLMLFYASHLYTHVDAWGRYTCIALGIDTQRWDVLESQSEAKFDFEFQMWFCVRFWLRIRIWLATDWIDHNRYCSTTLESIALDGWSLISNDLYPRRCSITFRWGRWFWPSSPFLRGSESWSACLAVVK